MKNHTQGDCPLVSVVTVVYNDETHVESTILSVLNQTFQNIEYIIIDGGSKDATPSIINKYSDRLAFYISEKDNGVYDAMNKAIRVANGEWIIFMNSGDSFYEKETLEKVFSRYQDKGEGLIYGDFFMINQRGAEDHYVKALAQTTDKFVADPSFHQAIFVRTSDMKAHPFDIRYKLIADYAYLYDLYKRNPGRHYTNTIICNYDGSGLSASTRLGLVKENIRFFLSRGEYCKFLMNTAIYLKRSILG